MLLKNHKEKAKGFNFTTHPILLDTLSPTLKKKNVTPLVKQKSPTSSLSDMFVLNGIKKITLQEKKNSLPTAKKETLKQSQIPVFESKYPMEPKRRTTEKSVAISPPVVNKELIVSVPIVGQDKPEIQEEALDNEELSVENTHQIEAAILERSEQDHRARLLALLENFHADEGILFIHRVK